MTLSSADLQARGADDGIVGKKKRGPRADRPKRRTDPGWVRTSPGPTHGPEPPTTPPYSEAQFKTLKYCPAFSGRFGSLTDARSFCQRFFDYYNTEHRHSGIGLHTPATVHDGTATTIRAKRAKVLTDAYAANPSRFHHKPTPPRLPPAAWINEPPEEDQAEQAA